ncbi:MAG: amidohydrolase family protein, partial [Acidimicrobiia bacterium]
MTLVIDNIGELVTNDAETGSGLLGVVHDAALLVSDDGYVAAIGKTGSLDGDRRLDAEGGAVLPGFVDSHTHLVFAGDRASEFAARMAGEPYQASGISTSVDATRSATDHELASLAHRRLRQAHSTGTTHVEIKSGYGLTVDDERRLLGVAGRLTNDTTFLGAHVVPTDYAGRVDDYVTLVTGEMLAACAPLSRWIDVFC